MNRQLLHSQPALPAQSNLSTLRFSQSPFSTAHHVIAIAAVCPDPCLNFFFHRAYEVFYRETFFFYHEIYFY
jgi:hypothetical protein